VQTQDRLRGVLRDLAEPVATAEGVDLVDLDVRGTGARQLVKVVVDRKGGVDLATCQDLSRDLSALLDREDPIDGRYALEVTSPGTDHPLRDRAAFDRVEGRAVLVHRRSGRDAPTQVRGTVTRAEQDAVVLDVDGEPVRVPYAEVVTAKQTLPW
jgi:ribosome maturation factor RimP